MNLYEVLGVAHDASPEEIRRAYHRLARRHHPDFHAGEPEPDRITAAEQMRGINEAWSVLSDPARRAAYDREAGRVPDADAFQPFDQSDEPDPRLAPDVPYEPAQPRWLQGALTLTPVACFGTSVAVFAVGTVLRSHALLATAVVLFGLSCVLFVALALLALSDARRHG